MTHFHFIFILILIKLGSVELEKQKIKKCWPKYFGLDGLSAGHVIYIKKCTNWSKLFSSILLHVLLSNAFMKSSIIPLGDTCEENNYRPIICVSTYSKIFEMILLHVIYRHLHKCDNEFGFNVSCVLSRKHISDEHIA